MPDHDRLRNAVRHIALAALAAVLVSTRGEAQLLGGALPAVGPAVGTVGSTVHNTLGGVTQTVNRDLGALHDGVLRDSVDRPLTALRGLERDPLGAPIVRGEIVAISPTPPSLAIAQGLSFEVARRETIEGLGLSIVVLQIPDGLSPGDALARLRAADPQGQYDFNHIYNPGGSAGGATAAAPQPGAPARIAMIDGGLERRHPAFRGVTIESRGFVGSCQPLPSEHGTAVASLLAGKSEARVPHLYAADVFCGKAEGGSAEAIVRALGWLASIGVPVINISLAGPPNSLLAAGVRSFLERGHLLVAAAGNDGPAAGPRYPAAYPGVVAVTSVDETRRVEIDAGQGDYIAFAARGVKVGAARLGAGIGSFTGTSFAAPIVARRLALLLDQPDPQRATWAVCVLRHQAIDLGAPGRDPVFGFGFVDDDSAPAPVSACGAEKSAARQ